MSEQSHHTLGGRGDNTAGCLPVALMSGGVNFYIKAQYSVKAHDCCPAGCRTALPISRHMFADCACHVSPVPHDAKFDEDVNQSVDQCAQPQVLLDEHHEQVLLPS